ncbi:MAG TPA: hypothetical protein VGS79_22200 [Puia sp.]|nr:hypothetical protein [Puia sp.]
MKPILTLLFILSSCVSFCQSIHWIPFEWKGDTVSGRYFDKASLVIPVEIGNIPRRFTMQLDLGADVTVLYGHSIDPFLDRHPNLKAKIDTSFHFQMQGQQTAGLRQLPIRLGAVSFGNRNIGYLKNFGDSVLPEALDKEPMVGTIAPDFFQDSVLIIDYPHKKLGVCRDLPKEYRNAVFQPCKINNGRIKIPFTINGKQVDLLFDTGSSLFSLVTTKENALSIAGGAVTDSLKISNWGDFFYLYGRRTTSPPVFAGKTMSSTTVYYNEEHKFDPFIEAEQIWGITGNAFFLDRIVIIDYKNSRFGVR